MNARHFIILFSLAAAPWVTAQTAERPAPSGTILDLVEEFKNSQPDKPNEITVVVPPPGETPPASEEPPVNNTPAEETAPPPVESAKSEPQPAAEIEAPVEAAPEAPKPGLAVRVERLQTGSAEIDPAKVKLLAPFPAKLLARAPQGWLIESSESAPPFTREVELSPGKRITLNVRPHLLVTEADGSNVFQIAEPGYDAALGYRQNATVSAILSTSIRQLEDDSQQLGTVIDQLQQLLVSLPQPSNTPVQLPEPEQPKPKTNRKR
jgi:hypothetical protein